MNPKPTASDLPMTEEERKKKLEEIWDLYIKAERAWYIGDLVQKHMGEFHDHNLQWYKKMYGSKKSLFEEAIKRMCEESSADVDAKLLKKMALLGSQMKKSFAVGDVKKIESVGEKLFVVLDEVIPILKKEYYEQLDNYAAIEKDGDELGDDIWDNEGKRLIKDLDTKKLFK